MSPAEASAPRYPLLTILRHRIGLDGEGVTTLVAGAGCPLSCAYCINREALLQHGEPVTARELFERVRIDDLYFRASGGGVTFGGGESLLHAAFLAEFRKYGEGWNLCAETSLNVPRALLETAIPAVDSYIVDVKTADAELYRRYTGGEAAPAWDNLRFLLAKVGPERVLVRVPRIPGYCDERSQARTADMARSLGAKRIECFSYVVKTP